MQKYFIAIGALSAATAVALGAFGAHGLKNIVSADLLVVWNTATDYHLIHSLALILVGALASNTKTAPGTALSGYLLIAGMVVFSGTLYVLSLTGIRWLGAITPLGGLALISAWVALAVAQFKAARA